MTKAPDRIFAEFGYDMERGSFWAEPSDQSIEYVRADHALALVAAAYEDAADTCFNPRWPLKTSTDHVQARTASIIRARTNTDAQAALDCVKREARNEVLRECLDIARLSLTGDADGRDTFDAIEALIRENQSDE